MASQNNDTDSSTEEDILDFILDFTNSRNGPFILDGKMTTGVSLDGNIGCVELSGVPDNPNCDNRTIKQSASHQSVNIVENNRSCEDLSLPDDSSQLNIPYGFKRSMSADLRPVVHPSDKKFNQNSVSCSQDIGFTYYASPQLNVTPYRLKTSMRGGVRPAITEVTTNVHPSNTKFNQNNASSAQNIRHPPYKKQSIQAIPLMNNNLPLLGFRSTVNAKAGEVAPAYEHQNRPNETFIPQPSVIYQTSVQYKSQHQPHSKMLVQQSNCQTEAQSSMLTTEHSFASGLSSDGTSSVPSSKLDIAGTFQHSFGTGPSSDDTSSVPSSKLNIAGTVPRKEKILHQSTTVPHNISRQHPIPVIFCEDLIWTYRLFLHAHECTEAQCAPVMGIPMEYLKQGCMKAKKIVDHSATCQKEMQCKIPGCKRLLNFQHHLKNSKTEADCIVCAKLKVEFDLTKQMRTCERKQCTFCWTFIEMYGNYGAEGLAGRGSDDHQDQYEDVVLVSTSTNFDIFSTIFIENGVSVFHHAIKCSRNRCKEENCAPIQELLQHNLECERNGCLFMNCQLLTDLRVHLKNCTRIGNCDACRSHRRLKKREGKIDNIWLGSMLRHNTARHQQDHNPSTVASATTENGSMSLDNSTGRNDTLKSQPSTSRVDNQDSSNASAPAKRIKLHESNKKEIEEKPDEELCKICMNAEMDTVFIGCGHLAVCLTCANDTKKMCPICRKKSKFIKIYKS